MENNLQSRKHLNPFFKAVIFLLLTISYVGAIFLAVFLIDNVAAKLNFGEDLFGYCLFALPFILILFIEKMICKKSDMPLGLIFFAPFGANLLIICGTLLFYREIGFYWLNDSVDINIIIGIVSVVRCIIYSFEIIRKKRFKVLALSLISTVLCVSCFALNEWSQEKLRIVVEENQSDITSSWDSINQMVERDDTWREIVTETEFCLSEIKKTLSTYGDVEYYCNLNTYPNIDGSTVCVPMAIEFAGQHLNFDSQNSRDITCFSTTHYAYTNLFDKADSGMTGFYYNDSFLNVDLGSVDLVIATHPSDEELEMAKEKGVELILEPVCYDAFVFITHKDNPVESLTVEQIKAIYSGEITNWKELGGKNEKIRAYQREANSGSQTAMERLVMGGTGMIDPYKVFVVEGMGELVEAVAEYENKTASIGYTYRYYIDNLYKNENIKTIAVNGIVPSDDNIRSGAYPYTTNYYGVIRKEDENEKGGKFLRWMLSDEGQACIAQAGYITMK